MEKMTMGDNFILKIKATAKKHKISFKDALDCEKFIHESAKIQSDINFTKEQTKMLKSFDGIIPMLTQMAGVPAYSGEPLDEEYPVLNGKKRSKKTVN